MESKPEPKTNLIIWLRGALALALITSFVLSNELNKTARNYEILTQEIRLLENKNYVETKKDVHLLEQARDALRECAAGKEKS